MIVVCLKTELGRRVYLHTEAVLIKHYLLSYYLYIVTD
jgi:hypothetical protein